MRNPLFSFPCTAFLKALYFLRSFLNRQLVVLLTFALLLLPIFSDAKHTVGGEMTYTCLGNGDYEFELVVFRDCAGEGAEFDEEAVISIYRCATGTTCIDLEQGSQGVNIYVPIGIISAVAPPPIACLDNSSTPCVERGQYTFKLSDYNIFLNPSVDSYHVVYQRCCRNQTISNIRNSGDVGTTLTVEIQPSAQELCNSSPVFSNNMPSIICNKESLNFQPIISDPDGDSLVFEFAPILTGGGPDLSSFGVNLCTGASPNPPCPPPFLTTSYVSDYSGAQPFGKSDSLITIDPSTGLISGVPNTVGQFVVGLAVSEYRNGTLIGTVQREFQVNVMSCDCTEEDTDMSTSTIAISPATPFTVFPNPVEDQLTIALNESSPTPYAVRLLDVQGQLVSSFQVNTATKVISTNHLPSGIYTLFIKTLDASYVTRIVKQ